MKNLNLKSDQFLIVIFLETIQYFILRIHINKCLINPKQLDRNIHSLNPNKDPYQERVAYKGKIYPKVKNKIKKKMKYHQSKFSKND